MISPQVAGNGWNRLDKRNRPPQNNFPLLARYSAECSLHYQMFFEVAGNDWNRSYVVTLCKQQSSTRFGLSMQVMYEVKRRNRPKRRDPYQLWLWGTEYKWHAGILQRFNSSTWCAYYPDENCTFCTLYFQGTKCNGSQPDAIECDSDFCFVWKTFWGASSESLAGLFR
jgi:hypothetical protein